jgi:predicted nucleic acid-binding protein
MKVGYVDTSCMVAIAFGEKGGRAIGRRLKEFDELVSANLLEAELRAAFRREGIVEPTGLPVPVSWVIPDRPLSTEIARVLATHYVRGADCWHLATALYLAEKPEEITFLSLDARQVQVAAALGFGV